MINFCRKNAKIIPFFCSFSDNRSIITSQSVQTIRVFSFISGCVDLGSLLTRGVTHVQCTQHMSLSDLKLSITDKRSNDVSQYLELTWVVATCGKLC